MVLSENATFEHEKAGVVPLIYCRGHCIPLWVVLPSLQVVLSFACSVASLSRFPSHYLPCQLPLPEAATADYLFDKGQPIHVVCRTCSSPWHFYSHTPIRGTERHSPPQIWCSGVKLLHNIWFHQRGARAAPGTAGHRRTRRDAGRKFHCKKM